MVNISRTYSLAVKVEISVLLKVFRVLLNRFHCILIGLIDRGYKPLILVKGSRSHQSKIQVEGRKDEDNRKKEKVALKNNNWTD